MSANVAYTVCIPRFLARRLYRLYFAVTVPGRFKHFRLQNLIAYRTFLMPASVMRTVCRNIYNPAAFCMAKCIRFHLFTAQFFPAIRTVDYRFV